MARAAHRGSRPPTVGLPDPLCLSLLLIALAASAVAHEINPRSVVIRGLQKTATVTVADCCGCPALIGAVSTRPDLFTVSPSSQSGVSATFTITSQSYGAGVPTGLLLITINGFATDPEGNPCEEVSTNPVPVVIAYDEVSSGTTEDAGEASDPINTFAGEYYREEPADLDLGGPLSVHFQRYYSTHLFREGDASSPLGPGWTHNFRWRLSKGLTEAEVFTDRGKVLAFMREDEESPWVLVRHPEDPYQLIDDAFQTILVAPDGTRFTFNFFHTLSQINDGRGNLLFITQVGDFLQSVTDTLGRTLNFSYDGDGLLTSVSDGTRSVQFGYTDGVLTGVVDVMGFETHYEYDVSLPAYGALMTAAELPLGNRPYVQSYDAEGRVATQADAYGNTYLFAYGANETTITDPLGRISTHAHSVAGRLEEYRDASGQMIGLGYDALGRRTEVTSRDGLIYRIDHNPDSGNPEAFTLPGGAQTTITYDTRIGAYGEVLSDLAGITLPDASQKLFEHDSMGRLTALTHRDGTTSTWSYNSHGQVLQSTNVLGATWDYAYDFDGVLTSVTDAFGNTTQFGYDALFRLSQVFAADAVSRSYNYDARNRIVAMTDEAGGTWQYAYDANGNLITMTDPTGAVSHFAFDLMDRLSSAESDDGAVASRSYDAMGRLASVTDRNGNTSTYAYDMQDLPSSVTDPAGAVWSVTRTPEGAVQSEHDPLGHTRSYTYDASGNLAAAQDPRGGTYQFTYDALLRPVQTTGPGGLSTQFSYDLHDQFASVVSGGTVGTQYTRNAAGQWTSREDANGSVWQRTRDVQGRLVSELDPLGNAIDYSYDNRNRVSQVTFPGVGNTLDLSYNARGQVAAMVYSDGVNLAFDYDAVGRCVSTEGLSLAYDAQGAMTQCNGMDITRDAGGRMVTLAYEPGKTVTYAYDSRNLVTSVQDWLGGTTTFEYDAARRRTRTTHANGVVTEYLYDADDNLIDTLERKEEDTLSHIALTRGLGGRVTSATRDVPMPAELSLGDEAFSVDAASQASGGTYDALGRLTQRGASSYTWDLAGRMTGYTDPGGSTQFTYDGFGHRLTAQHDADPEQQEVWLYALDFPRIAMLREGGDTKRYDIWEPDGRLLYTIDVQGRHIPHFDEMGNTLFVTDGSGAVEAQYAYDPYGRLLGAAGTAPAPYTYGGQFAVRREGDLGLYEVGARFYDAERASFLTRDLRYQGISPLEVNPYGYARNNPLLFLDPLGTNARVNGNSAHSDISVDIWEGDKIVGIYTVTFSARAWSTNCSSASDLVSGAGQVLLGFVPGVGAEGQLDGDFTLRGGVGSTSSSGKLIVPGSRSQDEQLAGELFKAQGLEVLDGEAPIDTLRRIMASKPTGVRNYSASCKSVKFVTDSEYGRYKVWSQVCNDFTDDMLDVYFGYNWYWGPIYTASGLVEELTSHLETKQRAAEAARSSRNSGTARFLNALPSLSWLSPI